MLFPSPTVLRVPPGSQNQCVVINVLTVSIRKNMFNLSWGTTVEVDSNVPSKYIFQHKTKDIPFGTSQGTFSLATSSGQTGSSLSSQKGHAEGVEEMVVQYYPALGDQVHPFVCNCLRL